MTAVKIAAEELERFTHALLEAAGTPPDLAGEVARHLVRANLSGHDSHGVIRVPQYVERIERHELMARARPELISETAATALVDGGRGFGHVAVALAVDWAIQAARRQGIACAAVRHCTHAGRLGEFTERAAAAGMLSILTIGAAGPGVGGMLPYGGAERFFGANPWSFSVPGGDGGDVVVDSSSSMVAEGKVRLALAGGKPLPPGVVTDADGRLTTDPEAFAGGGLVPLGGEVAGHKGMGLALASALFGALAMIEDPEPTLIGARVQPGYENATGQAAGALVIVIDPSRFGDGERYAELVAASTAALRAVRQAPGVERVLVPGEPEWLSRQRRQRTGLELPEPTWEDLIGVARRYGVTPPATAPPAPAAG